MANLLTRLLPGRTGQSDSVAGSAAYGGLFWSPDGTVIPIDATKASDPNFSSGSGLWAVARRGGELRAVDAGFAQAYTASVWAFRCLNVRANKVTELLAKAEVHNADGEPVDDHPLLRAFDLAYEVFDQDPFEQLSYNLDIFGEAFVEKVSGQSPMLPNIRLPMTVRVLPSLAVEPVVLQGRITGFEFFGDATMHQFKPDEVAYMRTYNPMNLNRGVSRLAAVLDEVNIDVQVLKFNRAFFRNGARPGLIISPKEGNTFTAKDYEMIKKWVQEQLTGADNAFRTLPLTKPMDVTVAPPPELEDQAYLSDDMMERICAGLGVPVGMVNFSNQPYQLSPEQGRHFYDNEIGPQARAIARFINARVRPFFDRQDGVTFTVEQAIEDVLETFEDQQLKENVARSQFESGRITLNESREAVGKPPVDDGDFYLIPTGYYVVRDDNLAILPDLLGPAEQAAGGAQPSIGSPNESGTPVFPPDDSDTPPPATPPPLPPGNNGNNGAGRTTPLALPSGQRMSVGVPDGTAILTLQDYESVTTLRDAWIVRRDTGALVRAVPDAMLHLTLVHCPLVDQDQFDVAFRAVSDLLPSLILTVSQMDAFENNGTRAVVLLVDADDTLREFQRRVYEALNDRGAVVSEYSTPDVWRPHITIAYENTALPFTPEPAEATARVGHMVFSRGDYTVEAAVAAADQPTVSSLDTPMSDPQRDELKAWRKVALRDLARAITSFECEELPDLVQDQVRAVLSDIALMYPADDDREQARDHTADLFQFVKCWMSDGDDWPVPVDEAVKQIQAVRLEYEAWIADLTATARSGEIDRRQWAAAMRQALRRYGAAAYRDGMHDAGVEQDSLDPEDREELERHLRLHSQYVSALGERLFHGPGITDAQAARKPSLWFHKSIMPLYQMGRMSARRNRMEEWLLGRTEAHCATCKAASGQRHRRRDWYRKGIVPQSDLLECKGFECDCKLVAVGGRARGNLSAIPTAA